MEFCRCNDERMKQDSRNDIKNTFSGVKISSKLVQIHSDYEPIQHEIVTSEIKLSNKRFI